MRRGDASRRKGQILILTTVSLTALLGFSALAIDVGQICWVKGEMQRNADAAALAGAAGLVSDDLLKANYDPRPDSIEQIHAFASLNDVGRATIKIDASDIVIGHLDEPLDASETIDMSMSDYNAVEVQVRRDAQMNGSLQTFFGGLLGLDTVDLAVSATAIIDDRFAGFQNPETFPGPLLPFAVSEDYYNQQLANPTDSWSWNGITGYPENVSDGIGEIWLFPEKSNGNGNGGNGNGGNGGGSGNFGSLNIGLGNQGTSGLGNQIVHGVSDQELIDEIGSDTLMFFDDDGDVITYSISGNPGISAGMTGSVDQRIGDVVGFLIHDGITGNGSDAQFNIIGMRFGRLMEVDLTGSPNNKRIVIQPVVYFGPGIIIDPDAESSSGLAYAVRLVR